MAASAMIARWHPHAQRGETLDVVPETMRLTLDVILCCTFGFPLRADNTSPFTMPSPPCCGTWSGASGPS